MKLCLTYAIIAGLVLPHALFAQVTPVEPTPTPSDATETIDRMLGMLHQAGEFTGTVLVARDGQVLYRNALAASRREADQLLKRPRNIASLAKAFTAMTVMLLKEQGKLSFDDPAAKFLPALSPANADITIRHLLSHTSGIPDVGDLGIDHPRLTESEVLRAVTRQQAHFDQPGSKYRYSNTGYMLLAMIVEQVSGKRFGDFLQTQVLQPLGMNGTALGSASSALGRTKGDGGMNSTLDDLLLWDQALQTQRLVSASTLAEAFTPARVREGETTYGFGWNITERDGARYVWHTGNSGGMRAFIGRWLEERLTVIILTDGDSRRTEIADAIFDILHQRPYVMPRLSIRRKILAVLEQDGIETAMERYHSLQAIQPEVYDFSERELNALGYDLLGRRRVLDAIRVFQLNTEAFPNSSNAFDSLAEAYQRNDQRDLAVQAYRRAVALDPGNLNAHRKLQELGP